MRYKIINFLKRNPFFLKVFHKIMKLYLYLLYFFTKKDNKMIIFASFGGRNFDDSPKALYDEICNRDEFNDYKLVWAFVNPERFNIKRGIKVKIDSCYFFKCLVKSKIWISNSGMSRGIDLNFKKIVKIETWHGTPLKKICGEENSNTIGGKNTKKTKADNYTIRCAQSEYDQKIFSRVFNSNIDNILLSDLPRNDALLKYTNEDIKIIRRELHIPDQKKIILYTPTYREYLYNNNLNFIKIPLNYDKWKNILGDKYVLLVRAHYAVDESLHINNNDFVYDVSNYNSLNDLYAISDLMITDYSSTYFDYSILEKPIFCFAYDLEEYKQKRGLYLDIFKELPCRVNLNEDELLDDILHFNLDDSIKKVKLFHQKYAPFAGNASKIIIDTLIEKINEEGK